jgi:hypothetical protein
MRDAGRDLHARVAAQQGLHERPRGSPVLDAEDATAGRSPARVGERDRERGHVERGGVGHHHRAAQVERREVGPGHLDTHGVEVDPGRGDAGPGERDQVAPDPAAQVDHRLGRGGLQPGGPVLGHGEPGGLLQAVGREVHPGSQVAELRHRPPAQRGLGQRRGHVLGSGLTPQLRGRLERVLGGLGGAGEQALSGLGEQPAKGVEVHRRIVSHRARCRVPARAGTRLVRVLSSALALSS